jgi:pimeloyl-ACP methyl ester carboxylesterase
MFFGFSVSALAQQTGDLFYVPKKHVAQAPALIITSCTGATQADIDSNRAVADSLGWVLATCAATRNRRGVWSNDRDLLATRAALAARYPVDTSRIFVYGFSGQGVQALMAVFAHPELFRGAVAICAHAQWLSLAKWETLIDSRFYLVSRWKDWNLEDSRIMHGQFRANGIRDTLVITSGRHEPKDRRELFRACQWLESNQ